MIDLAALDLVGESGLLGALEGIVDHRMRRGVRHKLPAILALATAATLAGARSVSSIGEYAADCPQEVLARLGAKYHPGKKRYIAPHAETFRRALGAVDVEALDRAVGAWLFTQVRETPLAQAVEALGCAAAAMVRRLGLVGVPPWSVITMVSRGRLLDRLPDG